MPVIRPAFLALLVAAPAAAAPPPKIDAAAITADVATLASDAFAGRGPGEDGETRTIDFLSRAFAAAGLAPGGDAGGWTQAVPLVRLDRRPGAVMTLALGDRRLTLTPGKDATLALRNPGTTGIRDAPLIFSGFGIVDRARGWDAWRGVDMAGKVAVILANDPDFEAGRDLGFEGERLVVAGRIGSKFAVAMAAGAIGVLVIHEDAAASYPWLQVGSGDALPAMAPAPLAASALKFSGWLRGDIAGAVLARAGTNLATAKARARDPGFTAFALPGASLSLTGALTATPVTSHNVIGIVPGATAPDEYVLYGAHWDANGRNGPDAGGDGIRNGAIDNATGTAELLAVARAVARGPRPARSMVFAAWTAEEKGLLGSEFYAGHPRFPLERTAAVINLDPHVVLPAARNLELVGGGRTSLEDDLRDAAAELGLVVTDEPHPEAGWYFRSDHYPFAVRGVPALSFRAGRDLVAGGAARGTALVDAYNANRYHQPSDAFDPNWTFDGTAQEATAALRLGLAIANRRDWPGWRPGVAFATTRDASASARAR